MNGDELLRRLHKVARARGIAVVVELHQGKGSHARLYFGTLSTTLKDRRAEISKGLLHKMLRDLGLTERDIGL